MLSELEAILERVPDGDREEREAELRDAARRLLERQFVYADDHGQKRVYDVVRRHAGFFDSYFAMAGFRLLVEPAEQMVGIVGIEGVRGRQMALDETMAMLAMRILFEERVRKGDVGEWGRCDVTLTELFSLVAQTTGRPMTKPTRCREIVAAFARNGLVRLKEELQDGDAAIEIRPAIVLVLSAASVESLRRYSGQANAVADAAANDGGNEEEA
jgi:hypothetical protein